MPRQLIGRVGQMAKEAREGAGLSQVELAERSGLQQPALSRLECGRANPTVDLLENIAKALGKSSTFAFGNFNSGFFCEDDFSSRR